MRDWRALLAERLRAANLPEERRAEIECELAAHLEEHFTDLRRSMSEEAAERQVLVSISNTKRLAAAIVKAEQEDEMNQRTRELWIPGMTVLLLSALLLRLLYAMGAWSQVFWFDLPGGARFGLVVYPYWLMSLPIFGALGAFLALRAGAARRSRVAAGVFPALAMGAVFSLLVPLAFFVDSQVAMLLKLEGMVLFILQWMVIPGSVLFLGTLPFVFSRPSTEMILA